MWNIAWPFAPIVAKPMTGLSSWVTMAAISVWKGRLPGPRQFGCAGSVPKEEPRLCRTTPVPGGTTPEPNEWKRLWMTLTRSPRPSMTTKPVVSPAGSPAAWACALRGSKPPRRRAA